jgi:hypothetical protein
MNNEYDLQNVENFKIDPHTWLQTLLAIAGDKEKKKEVLQIVGEQVDLPAEQVEQLMAMTIKILMSDTRSN